MNANNALTKEILIIHPWGLGDMILLTPVLNIASQIYPEIRFSFLTFLKASSVPIMHAPYVQKIEYTDWSIKRLLKSLHILRRKNFYAAICTSGVTAWKGGLFLLLLRAKFKIGQYRKTKFPGLSKYSMLHQEISRTENNYNLLSTVLKLPLFKDAENEKEKWDFKPHFYLTDSNRDFAVNFLNLHSITGKMLIGIHPGCMAKNKYRRWPEAYFITLINLLKSKYACEIIVFGGPEELKEAQHISQETKSLLIAEEALDNVAAVISQLSYFINTDSGLGHVASCFGIKTLTIFGPANERQTAPFSTTSYIIRKNLPCAPCIRKRTRNCHYECLNDLLPEEVFTRFNQIAIQEKG